MGFATQWSDDNKAHNLEGSTGVKNLCRMVRALGYQDFQSFGAFAHDGAYGDLFTFLEDNPGAIQAMFDWVDDNFKGHCSTEDCENEVEDGDDHCPDCISRMDEDDG
jgi:hypothetical protein